jgi:hypothetical protein
VKTKLLRKLRKRFGYYFNIHGWPVLVDHTLQKVFIINQDDVMDHAQVKNMAEYMERIEVDMKTYSWRLLKTHMGKAFHVDLLQHTMYKQARKYAKEPEKYKPHDKG